MSILIRNLAFCIFFNLNLNVFAQSSAKNIEPKLIPYRKGAKWGITDTAGNFVLQPKYKEIRIQRTGHFVFRRSNKEALADKNGKLLTPFKYTSISDFGPAQSMQVETPEVLALIKINKKEGFLDTLGKEALPPKYRLTKSFGGGLFAAGSRRKSKISGIGDGKVGLFKTGGRKLLPRKFSSIDRGAGGYLLLNNFRSGRVGLANPLGQMIIPAKQVNIYDISQGLIPATVLGQEYPMPGPELQIKVIFFDSTGRIAFNRQFTGVKSIEDQRKTFFNGLAAVRDENRKWGYINKKGETVIPFIYESAQIFNNGYAIVSKDKDLKTSGLIDTAGNVILPFEYSLKWDVKGRLVNQTEKGNTWLDIRKDANSIKITAYDNLDYFYFDNLILAGQNGKAGYLDRKGNVAIPFVYEKGDRFSDGFAAVKKDGKWGFIDTTGQVRIPFLYDDKRNTTYMFTDGLAAVMLNRNWGYINKNGRVITGFLDYGGSQPIIFENGLVKYWAFREGDGSFNRRRSDFTIIDTTGKPITDQTFTSVGSFENGFAKVCRDNYCGLIDSKGKLIVPVSFEIISGLEKFKTTLRTEISIFHYGLLMVRDPETHKFLGYISKTGKQFWQD